MESARDLRSYRPYWAHRFGTAPFLPMSRAAVATGADGLLIEVHHDPDRALSDGAQSIFPDQFDELMAEIRQIAAVVHRHVQEPLPQPTVAKAAS